MSEFFLKCDCCGETIGVGAYESRNDRTEYWTKEKWDNYGGFDENFTGEYCENCLDEIIAEYEYEYEEPED